MYRIWLREDLPEIINSKGERSMNQTRASRFGHAKREGIIVLTDNPGPGK
jgi:hypothetical protein